MTKKTLKLDDLRGFFKSGNKSGNIFRAFYILYGMLFLCSACSKEDFHPQQQLLENQYFDHGLRFWEQDDLGARWQSSNSSAHVEGFNNSKFLYQGRFGNGKFKIKITVSNDNPVIGGYSTNGFVKVYQKNNGSYHFLKEGVLIKSASKVTQEYTIYLDNDYNTNAIALRVERAGPGSALNMVIHDIQLYRAESGD
jgi:hypothetical protein